MEDAARKDWKPRRWKNQWARLNLTLTQRWADKIVLPVSGEDCWGWIGAKVRGYGAVLVANKKRILAHRLSYERFVGPIPAGLVIDHLCRNTGCCNPAHLEAVTQAENIRRGDGIANRNAAKTHCPQGHEYAGANVRLYKGGRWCIACERDRYSRRIA